MWVSTSDDRSSALGRRLTVLVGAGLLLQVAGLALLAAALQREQEIGNPFAPPPVLSLAMPLIAGLALTVIVVAGIAVAQRGRLALLARLPPVPLFGGLLLLSLAAGAGVLTATRGDTGGHHAGGAAGDHEEPAVTRLDDDPTYRALAQVLDTQGIEAALTRLEEWAAIDTRLQGEGHQVAHALGKSAFAKYGSARAAFPKCRELFQSGCYHGVLQAHFEANAGLSRQEIAGLCSDTVPADQALTLRFQCVHGLGHGLMGRVEHDVPKALTLCDYLGAEWDRQSCYGGVFMENIINYQMQLRNPGHHGTGTESHAVYLKADDPLFPCTIVGAQYQQQCYLMQTSAILMFNGTDYGEAFRTCLAAPAEHVTTCYQSLGRDISGNTVQDSDRSLALCALGDARYRGHCYMGVVKNFIDVNWRTDQASAFCARVPDGDKPLCYGAVGEQIATLFAGPEARRAECAKAEPSFVAACDAGAGVPTRE